MKSFIAALLTCFSLPFTALAGATFKPVLLPGETWPGFPTCTIQSSGSPAVDGNQLVVHIKQALQVGFNCGEQLLYDDGATRTVILVASLPGGAGEYLTVSGLFGAPDIDDGDIAFRATENGGVGGADGLWVLLNGTLTFIARNGVTPIPDGGGSLFAGFVAAFSPPRIDAERVAFIGADGTAQRGVYVWDAGVLSTVVDTSDVFPGGSAFSFFGGHAIDGTKVYFTAGDGVNSGLFEEEAGVVTTIAQNGTAIPGGGTFGNFGVVDASDGSAAFSAANGSEGGLYLWDGSTITTVAETGMASPGSGTLTGIGAIQIGGTLPAIDAGRVAFVGTDADGSGVFFWNGSNLERITSAASPPLGDTVTLFKIKSDSLSGSTRVFYTDVGAGIEKAYKATLTEDVPVLRYETR